MKSNWSENFNINILRKCFLWVLIKISMERGCFSGSELTVINIISCDEFNLKILGNIESCGQDHRGQDEDKKVSQAWAGDSVRLEVDWFVHCHQPLSGDAHHEKGLQGDEDSSHGVPEVRKDQHQILCNIHILIHKNNWQEHNVTHTESHQTLMKCYLDKTISLVKNIFKIPWWSCQEWWGQWLSYQWDQEWRHKEWHSVQSTWDAIINCYMDFSFTGKNIIYCTWLLR